MAYTEAQVIKIITKVANQKGVSPALAVADAQWESRLNPYSVTDNGTSFGLYSLHEGGELGNLTPQQAFNPTTNAQVALTQFANVERTYPTMSPGWVAATAERPNDPSAYAQQIQANYDTILAHGMPSSGQTFSSGGVNIAANNPSLKVPLSGISSLLNPKPVSSSLSNPLGSVDNLMMKLAYMGAGLAIILVGLFIAFKNTSAGKEVQSAAKDSAEAGL